jgi:hypothetical protein
VGENHAAHAAAAQQPAGDQKTQNPALFIAAFLTFTLILFTEGFLLISATPLTQEVSKQQAAHAPAPQCANANREAQDASFLATVFLTFLKRIFTLEIFVLVSLAQEVGEQQAAHALTLQHAATNQYAR